jgi:hypothetical protein
MLGFSMSSLSEQLLVDSKGKNLPKLAQWLTRLREFEYLAMMDIVSVIHL